MNDEPWSTEPPDIPGWYLRATGTGKLSLVVVIPGAFGRAVSLRQQWKTTPSLWCAVPPIPDSLRDEVVRRTSSLNDTRRAKREEKERRRTISMRRGMRRADYENAKENRRAPRAGGRKGKR